MTTANFALAAAQLARIARMDDAAYAQDLTGQYEVAAGYYGGPDAYHVWAPADWQLIHGYALPIWVAGENGTIEGRHAVGALKALSVPHGAYTVVDMESRIDRTYVESFYDQIRAAGYRLWVYGSRDSVYNHPVCNGYWVAAYGLRPPQVMTLLGRAEVRAVQYEPDIPPGYDASLIRAWTAQPSSMWRPVK
jgi:hypothetical protein